MANRAVSVIDRFLKYAMPEPMSGCWLWAGPLDGKGYGMLRLKAESDGRRPSVRAHRFSYELHKGPIPGGLVLDHLCRVRSCCNPDHLEPVTTRENILRGHSLFAQRARQTHCHNGHEFTEANTKISSKGGRTCRTCYRAWDKERYARDRQRDRIAVIPQCGTRSGYEKGCRCGQCKLANSTRGRSARRRG